MNRPSGEKTGFVTPGVISVPGIALGSNRRSTAGISGGSPRTRSLCRPAKARQIGGRRSVNAWPSGIVNEKREMVAGGVDGLKLHTAMPVRALAMIARPTQEARVSTAVSCRVVPDIA